MSAAVVLAAGSGSRLGGVAKAMLRTGERTFLSQIVELVRSIDGGPVIVVVGPPYGEAVAEHARSLTGVEIAVVENPDPARGMASSVALGFAGLESWSEPSSAYLWPVDHPLVKRATLEALERAMGSRGVARPTYRGRGGHPPLIARGKWSRFATCDEVEGGARAVMAKLDVVDVPVDDPGVVRDIDTPEDRQVLP